MKNNRSLICGFAAMLAAGAQLATADQCKKPYLYNYDNGNGSNGSVCHLNCDVQFGSCGLVYCGSGNVVCEYFTVETYCETGIWVIVGQGPNAYCDPQGTFVTLQKTSARGTGDACNINCTPGGGEP